MDLFDVAINSADTTKVIHRSFYQDAAGSYRPLTGVFFKDGLLNQRFYMENDQGERVMFVSTNWGNVVLHERSRSDNFVIAVAPKEIEPLLGKGKLTEDQITMVLGLWGKDNIGQTLAGLTKYKQDKVA